MLDPPRFLAKHKPQQFKPPAAKVPAGGYRVAEVTRANARYLCGVLKIRLPRYTLHPTEPTQIKTNCMFRTAHHDRHPSAQVTIYPAGHKHDVWVKCFACKDAEGNLMKLNMPLATLWWQRTYKPKAIRNLRPTKAQLVCYGARIPVRGGCQRPPVTVPVDENLPTGAGLRSGARLRGDPTRRPNSPAAAVHP